MHVPTVLHHFSPMTLLLVVETCLELESECVFLRLSCEYKCSIYSCTNSHKLYTRTPYLYHAYTNKPVTILKLYRILREITRFIYGSVGDERVVFLL
jgi:hypothetical protein